MPVTENKVRYGLKKAYYSVLTESTGTYATPVAIPDAVAVTLSAVGELVELIGDDVVSWMSQSNGGYDGNLEAFKFPESFYVDVLGDVVDGKGVRFEKTDAVIKPFALLFEFDGDQHAVKHALYRCFATRPNIEGKTTNKKETVNTSVNIKARANSDKCVKSNTRHDTDATVATNWYTTVQEFVAGT